MIEKMLINNARQAILENITALDKKTLQRELESHLKLEFKYKDEIDRLNIIINEIEKFLDKYYKSNRKWYNTELSNNDRRNYEKVYKYTEFMIVKFLNKLKELKENNE